MTTASYEIRAGPELDALIKRLERYPQIVEGEVVLSFRRIVIKLADNVGRFTPVYRARLKTAILSSPRVRAFGGVVEGTVDDGQVGYGQAMEFGPPAGEWPDMAELGKWAERTLGDAALAQPVARALYEGRSRSQVQPYAMFARGWRETIGWAGDELRGMLGRVVERLAGR